MSRMIRYRNVRTGKTVAVEEGSIHDERLSASDRVETVEEESVDLEAAEPAPGPEIDDQGPEIDDGEEE